MEPHGTCFIYGGRQLGKTALLRSVEHDFHRPHNGQVAKWIDLRIGGIGSLHPPANIWALIAHELRDCPPLESVDGGPNTQSPSYADKLIDSMERWIKSSDNHRLLLLLDEADDFLAADAATADFRESARLKGLMDRTGRRFKVVLAGLHNVLRTTERSNHPLAHYGRPIRVGPLLTNGEWHEAQNLVRDPLRAMGYRFARDELVTRILAQTNYYPSLIQLYGAELVRQLRDFKETPPYAITRERIDAVYRDAELQRQIRDRFSWTLLLDPRYEVIAYTIAWELLDSGATAEHGLDPQTISKRSRFWWGSGFDKTPDVEFNVLLDEMVGLGVLRPVGDNPRYTLRNPNMLLLLGGPQEVEQVLLKEREVEELRNPGAMHPPYRPDKRSTTKYAPLTHEQVGRLLTRRGVAVISGSAVGYVDRLREYFDCCGNESIVVLPRTSGIDDFRRRLLAARSMGGDAMSIIFVHPEIEWTPAWLEVARDVQRGRKSGRVIFVATPDRLWRTMGDPALPGMGDVEWYTAGPWNDATGGWPLILERFARRRRAKEWASRLESMKEELVRSRGNVLDDLGVSAPDARRELALLHRYEPFGREMVADIAVDAKLDPAVVHRRMEWGERLGLVSQVGSEWMFNRLVARLLSDGNQQ